MPRFKLNNAIYLIFTLSIGFASEAAAQKCGPTTISADTVGATPAGTTTQALGPFTIKCVDGGIYGDLTIKRGGDARLALEAYRNNKWDQVKTGNHIVASSQPGMYRFTVTNPGKIGTTEWSFKYRVPVYQ